jgi:hypothetical protein
MSWWKSSSLWLTIADTVLSLFKRKSEAPKDE